MRWQSNLWSCVAARVLRCLFAVSLLTPAVVADEPTAPATADFESSVRAALDMPGDWEFVDVPLQEVAQHLSEKLHVDVLLDSWALNDQGIDPAQPVTMSINGITARSALRLLLDEMELTCIQRDDAIWITSHERAETELISRVYPVGDLIGSSKDDDPLAKDHSALVTAITDAIAPDTWDDVGGPGSIGQFLESLVISQTLDVHEQIEQLLAAYRQMIAANAAEVIAVDAVFYAGQEGDARIRAVLDVPINGEFVDASLRDVVNYLSEAADVPIVLDTSTLEDFGIDLNKLISAHFSQIALGHALRRILYDLELTYMVRDEVLHITSPEVEEARLALALYPVVDLTSPDSRDYESNEIQALFAAIESTVEPYSWDAVGGPGALVDLNGPQRCLLIAQTETAHEEIRELLAKLRWAKQVESERTDIAQDTVGAPYVRVYAFQPVNQQAITPADVIPLILRELGEEIWAAEDGVYLEILGSSLVAKHRPEVHRRLSSYLQQLGVWNLTPKQKPKVFGGVSSGLPGIPNVIAPSEKPAAGD